jgi:hypothetical protein|uniref:Uncharacterized protein n=1 Tax=Myoviridae sp. ctshb19 TaxID=2825194 RepID=A0A8S5UGN1_9CAUD|nr:MAG TPA: hypothetical protein [Myoviridae sp. ctshb19]
MQRNNKAKMSNTYVVRQNTTFKKYYPLSAVKTNYLEAQDQMAIAYALYDAGFPPAWTFDITGALICGYGDCVHGFRYELMPVDDENISKGIVPWADVKASFKRLADQGEIV